MILPELIAALEAATGPSVFLDMVIHNYRYPDENSTTAVHKLLSYTASLDATMTLARNAVEGLVMLSIAFHAAKGGEAEFEKWPSIKAMLISALRGRLP